MAGEAAFWAPFVGLGLVLPCCLGFFLSAYRWRVVAVASAFAVGFWAPTWWDPQAFDSPDDELDEAAGIAFAGVAAGVLLLVFCAALAAGVGVKRRAARARRRGVR